MRYPYFAEQVSVHPMFDNEKLYGGLFIDAGMAALFSDRATVQAMLDFESALARAQAECGAIPGAAVAAIIKACDAALYDCGEIGQQATLAGNPAIPLVKMLTAEVAKIDRDAARYVHFGATSQDVIDSGRAFQWRKAINLFDTRIEDLSHALARLVKAHRNTPMMGRTFLQQAVPISFAHKAALWLDPVQRQFKSGRQPDCSLAGAAGTLAALGGKAAEVASAFRAITGTSAASAIPSHTSRSHVAHIACDWAVFAGHLGKIARDISLMAQTEMGEVAEPDAPGKGGSSTMPHKRNPVLCTMILANVQRTPGLAATMLAAMPQEHERAVGGWHAEWRTLVELLAAVGTALLHTVTLIEGLQVFPEKMRANIGITNGLVMAERVAMALAGKIGRAEAHHLIEAASRQTADSGTHLRECLAADAIVQKHLTASELHDLFDPVTYRGATDHTIDLILEDYRQNFEEFGRIKPSTLHI
ncbi:MAG: 3-carboxy-cis,cis-muconate cycloisomerase [Beijerinckiaceae bacterium]